MNKLNYILLAFITIISFEAYGVAPFSKGVNLSKWYEESAIENIQFSKYTKNDFEQIKSLGFDVIRLPINLMYFSDVTTNQINPLLFDILDHPIAWAEELGIYLILDNHTLFDNVEKRYVNSNNAFDQIKFQTALTSVWSQMADYYKDKSDYIVFEIQNEPNNPMTTSVWSGIQQAAIDAIRAKDTNHYIIVGGAKSNSLTEMMALPIYADSKIIYTFHFYEPMVFTHQGANWVKPSASSSLGSLQGVPFPYNASTMPAVPEGLKGTWVEDNMKFTYPNQTGNVNYLINEMSRAKNFGLQKNVPVFCGEFGVYDKYAATEDKNLFTKTVREELEKGGVAWSVWEYKTVYLKDGFGLFKKNTYQLFEHDLNTSLLTALGLNIPPQTPYVKEPAKNGFLVYNDYTAANVSNTSGKGGGIIDFYNANEKSYGKYSIFWAESNQYAQVSFTFSPLKDLTWLRNNGAYVQFDIKAKCARDSDNIDIRLLDKNNYRFKFPVDKNLIKWNSDEWQTIQAPLKDFYLAMSGVTFDWTNVLDLEIVNEYGDFKNKTVWIDNVSVVSPNSTAIPAIVKNKLKFKIYPNPLNKNAQIDYEIDNIEQVNINIYTVSGQKIMEVVNEKQNKGKYSISLQHINNFKPGIYFCTLQTESGNSTIKFTK
ncbi:MAG: hypothetical protein AUK44_04460 [Porphyromonadaceae bacterium CG2_30_38_12]|nr:MAG: hypothetical protein AUK44_04460 [Porphyromonadaceae bacterium CG2_30_38_12]